MTTQPQSPSEQEIRTQVENAITPPVEEVAESGWPNDSFKKAVDDVLVLINQAADKREQEARLNELNMLGKFWQTGIGKYAGETTQQWKQRVADYVIERSAILDRQARAAEGEGKQ